MKTPSKAGLLIAIGGVLAVVVGLVLKYALDAEVHGLVEIGMSVAALGAAIQVLVLAELNLAAVRKACAVKPPSLMATEVTWGTQPTEEIKLKEYSFKPKQNGDVG